MTAMTHHGLPITGDHAVAPTGCAECESPGSDAAPEPCDHAGMTGECAAMLSCASTPAEPQSPPVLRVAHASGLVAAPVSQPATLTLSPETPPPRA